MKRDLRRVFIVVACAITFAGCGKKEPSPTSALENASKAFQTDQAAAAPAAPAAQPVAAQPAAPAATATVHVSDQMNQAVASYKTGNYIDAVTRLQWLRARKGNTPQQILALQEATGAVMNEIAALAQRGDARAKEALKEYTRLQNQ